MSASVFEAETMFEFGNWEIFGFNTPMIGYAGLTFVRLSFFDAGNIDYVDGTSEESYEYTRSAASPFDYTGLDFTASEQNKIAWNLRGWSNQYANSYYTLQNVSYDPSTQTTVFYVLYFDESAPGYVPRPFQMLFSYMKTPSNVYSPPNGSVVFTRNINETTFKEIGSPPDIYGPFTFIGGANNDGYYFSKISDYSFNRQIKDYFNGT